MDVRRKTMPMLLAAAILVVAIAGCGSSSSKSSTTAKSSSATAATTSAASGGQTTSSSSGTAPTGAPIKLGTIASCGGPLASGLGGVCTTITAWAKWVNASGGINGHPVQVTVIDDAGSPTAALAGVKKLVEQDKVMAIVGEYSVDDPAWASYVTAKKVPVVGGGSTEPPFATSPDFFPSGSQVPAYEYAQAAVAKQEGKTKLGFMYCAEAPTCATNGVITKLMIKNGLIKGQQLVYESAISATAPSFTSNCLAAKDADVDALLVSDAAAIAERVVQQCQQQGYSPLLMAGGGVVSPSYAKSIGKEPLIHTVNNIPLSDTQNAANQTMKAALAKYAPSLNASNPQYNPSVTNTWAGGLLFQAAAKAANIGPTSTSADVLKGLYALKNETLGGMSPAPLNFKAGQITQVNCAFIQRANDGILTSDPKPICIPGDATPYYKVLGG